MEEDTGKVIYIGSETAGSTVPPVRWIDYGLPVPACRSSRSSPNPDRAGARAPDRPVLCDGVVDLLRALDVSDVRMDPSDAPDANVSLKPAGTTDPHLTETKNVNFAEERRRRPLRKCSAPGVILASGGRSPRKPDTFTRPVTPAGRAKETARDYRYFPEPIWRPGPVASWSSDYARRSPNCRGWFQQGVFSRSGVLPDAGDAIWSTPAPSNCCRHCRRRVQMQAARAWWGNFLAQKANEAGIGLDWPSPCPGRSRGGIGR